MHDVVVVGAGIVGLSSAWALLKRFPHSRVLVLEKEADCAKHQSGRNSGVIHSGIYYKPGSFKARLSQAGNRSMVAFCREHGIPFKHTGKLIVAARVDELTGLQMLYERGLANGLQVHQLDASQLKRLEPHATGLAALQIPSAAVTDYGLVCRTLLALIQARGGRIVFNAKVERAHDAGAHLTLETTAGTFSSRLALNCAGLHSDRVARAFGLVPPVRIIPFRGEYYELVSRKRQLVKGLVYPVPDPNFPFLGVHFTKGLDESVHVGPNAVVSLKREGYGKRQFHWQDAQEIFSYPGFWRLAVRHTRAGVMESMRSRSKALFLNSARRLIPELAARDLTPGEAGVRAQAVGTDGGLLDDFLFVEQDKAVHVLNAPSPAATCALEIGELIADRVAARSG